MQVKNFSEIVKPGQKRQVALTISVPGYVVAKTQDFSIRVRSAEADRYWLGDTRQYKLVIENIGTALGLALNDWNVKAGVLAPIGLKAPWAVPGFSMPLKFSVTNKGTGPDRFQVKLEGFPDSWLKLPKARKHETGQKYNYEIQINFPQDAKPTAYAYTIKVHSDSEPKVFEKQEGVLLVLPTTMQKVEKEMELYRQTLEPSK